MSGERFGTSLRLVRILAVNRELQRFGVVTCLTFVQLSLPLERTNNGESPNVTAPQTVLPSATIGVVSMKKIVPLVTITAVVALAFSSVFGCSKKPGPEGGPMGSAGPFGGQPPAEAFTACDGKKSGDSCSIKMGDRETNGSCVAASNSTDNKLSCRPDRPAK